MILFISDLHLQEQRPDISRAFFNFLQQHARHAQQLYILGDFFEVWIGDDAMSEFQQQVAHALKQLSQHGCQVFLMHGNRDFLIGQQFCQLAGCTLLPDPSVIQIQQTPILLSHGDLLCTEDVEYLKMRRILRNPLALFILRHLPLTLRHKLARGLRNQSQSRTSMKAASITDVTPEAVAPFMQKYGVHTLIHGHTHRPAKHALILNNQQPATRIVLGDWDKALWYLRCDPQQSPLTFSLQQAPITALP